MKPYLNACSLSAGYDQERVLTDISLQVRAGEILTLIGPNGAGKTTLLKTLAGHLRSLQGSVFLCEKELFSLTGTEIARQMAVLFTERPASERLTCLEAVEAGRIPYTGRFGVLTSEDEKIALESMRELKVEDLAYRPIDRISDGQRQRVLIARALCQQPHVLILDEPTGYLDIRHKLELLSLLRHLAKNRGLAIILSMHEIELAQRISDYVVCVAGGKAKQMGTPEEIFVSGTIQSLYGFETGSYYEPLCLPEPEAIKGIPDTFVIGGAGSGLSVYHRLWRKGIPFAAGILTQNDLEIPVARALACSVVEAPPFEPVSVQTEAAAETLLKSCRHVLCPLTEFGSLNSANYRLRMLAESLGTLETL